MKKINRLVILFVLTILYQNSINMFCKVTGSRKIYDILVNEKFPAWKLVQFDKEKREKFLEKRKKYLFY